MTEKKLMEDDELLINLSDRQDEYGFIYGQISQGERHHNVNILAPLSHWQGGDKLSGYEPHESDWIIYVDGQEYARVSSQGDIEQSLKKLISREIKESE